MKKQGITILRDGPYAVTADVPLNTASIECDAQGDSERWARGETCETGEKPYALCRCGRSERKPFCDGTHGKIGFHGTETADRPAYAQSARRYRGKGIDLLDEESLCAVARFCDKGDTIWRAIAGTDSPEVREEVVREAANCPGGRLSVVTHDGERLEPDLPREISLVEDPSRNCRGPLWVKGGITVTGADGEQYETRNRVALCRCGESENMPYCDASHYECRHMQGLDS